MTERKPWPKDEMVGIGGPEMPMAERVVRYRANVMAIREAGHAVPPVMADTLDAAEIEAWLRELDENQAALARIMRHVGGLPEGTTFPSPLPADMATGTEPGGRPYPGEVCMECGTRHGRHPPEMATWSLGVCGVCGRAEPTTQPRDFGHLRPSWRDATREAGSAAARAR